ncbi:substrate-binding periplasmic protein [Cellvibrio polysaccharolyticus]|uniref:Solute-binding protein family 3/N-terminal domain-containing protein n=1 Tax=Cellvibrio polysaccharolyticus TaxID=2082724 RepID=A0A928V4B9_9GAMM|nr:transporter substrate-binding domain-containing protein [Cellvibrio polysaccharolyticus]MBE8716646.1 hypothetical protein [Cellvibrio polysaccharolyticus]
MKQIPVIMLVWLLAISPMSGAALTDREIRLGTNMHLAPDATNDPHSPRTGSFEPLQCILDRLGQPYSIITKPWRRAYQEVRKELLDGFFTAIALRDTQRYGSLSEPLVLENWYWFWRADMPPASSWRDGYRLGTILGSQQELWLTQEGFPKTITANNLPQLLKMLFSGRIDVLLADKDQFEDAFKQLAGEFAYQSRFFRYVPLSVYFGHPFLKQHPDFLKAFNRAMPACVSDNFSLSPSEQKIIEDYLAPLMAQWLVDESLTDAVQAQNKNLAKITDEALQQLESEWLVPIDGEASWQSEVVNHPVSVKLRGFKQQAAPLITEIIVMDARGATVASSDATTNFLNHHEEKYLSVFGKPEGTLLVEPVMYDASTRHFQVHVSAPVYIAGVTQSVGVLTVGVDVEQALSLDD